MKKQTKYKRNILAGCGKDIYPSRISRWLDSPIQCGLYGSRITGRIKYCEECKIKIKKALGDEKMKAIKEVKEAWKNLNDSIKVKDKTFLNALKNQNVNTAIVWDEAKIDKRKQGRRNRINGKAFELKVRADLISKGWIVIRNSNDVELVNEQILSKEGKRIGVFKQAKGKFNPFTKRVMSIQTGFPDFIAFRDIKCLEGAYHRFGETHYEVIGVECKLGKYLDKIEKEKVEWLLNNEIFNYLLIAYKDEKKIVYIKNEKGGITKNG